MVTSLFPDESRRPAVTRTLWRGVAQYSLLYGEACTAGGLRGIACWLAPGHTHKTLPRMLRAGMGRLLLELNWGELRANIANDLYAEAQHSLNMPADHWYLIALAVDPACQGQGIGSALMRPMLARSDAEQRPIYLETHKPRNVAFYAKHGFAVVAHAQVPGNRVTVFFMVRRPN